MTTGTYDVLNLIDFYKHKHSCSEPITYRPTFEFFSQTVKEILNQLSTSAQLKAPLRSRLLTPQILDTFVVNLTPFELACLLVATLQRALDERTGISFMNTIYLLEDCLYLYSKRDLQPTEATILEMTNRGFPPHIVDVENFVERFNLEHSIECCHRTSDSQVELFNRTTSIGPEALNLIRYLDRHCVFFDHYAALGLALTLLDRHQATKDYYPFLFNNHSPHHIYTLRSSNHAYPYVFKDKLSTSRRKTLGIPSSLRLTLLQRIEANFLYTFKLRRSLA